MAVTARKQENLRRMRGYQTSNGGAVLDCACIEQKKLPHLADLDDENQAGREDEPLKHIDDCTENSSTDSTNMKEPVLVKYFSLC